MEKKFKKPRGANKRMLEECLEMTKTSNILEAKILAKVFNKFLNGC